MRVSFFSNGILCFAYNNLFSEVLGQTPDEFEETRGVVDDEISLPYGASR